MPWRDVLPVWRGMQSIHLILLSLAMICFPFSVAATNVCLGTLLGTGLLTGAWWQGVLLLWRHYRMLSLALLAYLALVLIGVFWSLDPDWGGRIVTRHWFWLLLPIVTVVLSSKQHRQVFLAIMSFGLIANLMFCVLQANGLVDTSVAGSDPDNATGYIGHTSFGFIYGIWSAWLVHWGGLHRGWGMWLAWALAAWAVVMVFMAQGQSGYVITVALLLLVVAGCMRQFKIKNVVMTAFVLLLIAGAVISSGAGKERIIGTWHVLTQSGQQNAGNTIQTGAEASARARLAWWSMSLDIWRQGGFFGVGTGGFPQAVKTWQADPARQHGYLNQYSQFEIVHPHNQYLITLVRYGVPGLLLLLALLYVWVATGLQVPWRESVVMPLVSLTGVALALHGLDSTSFEEHFSSIFAVILLAAGLSEASREPVSG